MPLSAEDQLVHDLQARLPEAFTHLYEAYSAALFETLFRLVKDRELAEDLLHDVFIKIWANIHLYRPDHGRLFTWLMTLTRHIAFDELRNQKMRQKYLLTLGNQPLGIIHSPFIEGTLMETLLDQLRPSYRQVVNLAYIHGYTQQEIAEHLQLPLGTVKSQIRAALHQLRDYCRDDIDLYYWGGGTN